MIDCVNDNMGNEIRVGDFVYTTFKTWGWIYPAIVVKLGKGKVNTRIGCLIGNWGSSADEGCVLTKIRYFEFGSYAKVTHFRFSLEEELIRAKEKYDAKQVSKR